MNQSLTQLQSQIDLLKAQVNPQSVGPQIGAPVGDLKQAIREVFAEELAALKGTVGVAPAPEPQLSLLQSIGLGLTEEEQVWLSSPDKLQGLEGHLPKFFQTPEGKQSVKAFIDFYRGIYGN